MSPAKRHHALTADHRPNSIPFCARSRSITFRNTSSAHPESTKDGLRDAGACAAGEISGIAADIDAAAAHTRAHEATGIAFYDQVAAGHEASGLLADIAIDRQAAAGHALAYMV